MKGFKDLIHELKARYNIYSTVTLKPSYKDCGNVYDKPKYEVYIARTESADYKRPQNLSYNEALHVLKEYLESEAPLTIKERRAIEIKRLEEQIEEIEEKINELKEDHENE